MSEAISKMIDSCRVPESVKSIIFGQWEITRQHFAPSQATLFGMLPYQTLTVLRRKPTEPWHDLGEVVMEDSPREIRRHLPILIPAQGRVMVSGLGLGCVIRGLLSKPEVTNVDVVEIDKDIAALVGQEFDDPRLKIHLGDAEQIEWPEGTRWDYCWHDVWSEKEALALIHARLCQRYKPMCVYQGAWMFPRSFRRIVNFKMLDGRPLTHDNAST